MVRCVSRVCVGAALRREDQASHQTLKEGVALGLLGRLLGLPGPLLGRLGRLLGALGRALGAEIDF